METICIRNNRRSRVVLRARLKGHDLAVQCRLMPGENDVKLSLWDQVKDRDATVMFLEEDVIKEMGVRKAKPLPTTATAAEKMAASGRRVDDLTGLDDEKSLALIGECADKELLKQWRKNTDDKALRYLSRRRSLDSSLLSPSCVESPIVVRFTMAQSLGVVVSIRRPLRLWSRAAIRETGI